MQKTKIEWVNGGYTWNPVSGCQRGCPYCYAAKIVHRFGGGEAWDRGSSYSYKLHVLFTKPEKPYPFYFEPTLHRYRLDEPQQIKTPSNIFVCSMADLFGEWVPDEWIMEVFKACEKAPQHRYLFLTKNIDVYQNYGVPTGNNYWYGQTWDGEKIGLTDYNFYEKRINQFLSFEPILSGRLPIVSIKNGNFGWVIIGAETGNRKGKIIPKREWIERIVDSCRNAGIPIFMKNSLAKVWGEPLIQEYPEGLKGV